MYGRPYTHAGGLPSIPIFKLYTMVFSLSFSILKSQ